MNRFLFLSVLILLPLTSYAEKINFIRDAETERFIIETATPLLKAANLPPEATSVYLVNDPTMNAFVYGGMNIFVHTGLLQRIPSYESLAGVLAHEIGHIAGGHLIKGQVAMEEISSNMIFGYLAGLAAIATNRPDVAMATIMAGTQAGLMSAIKFTREQEEAADLLGLKYLNKTKTDPHGLVNILKIFVSDMRKSYTMDQINPYTLTHPLSNRRIDFLLAHMSKTPDSYSGYNKERNERLDIIVAKLYGFLGPLQETAYDLQNTRNALYRKAILKYRTGDVNSSIAGLNKLLHVKNPDPYILETKAQIEFESGRTEDSEKDYYSVIEILTGQYEYSTQKYSSTNPNNLIKLSWINALLHLDHTSPKYQNKYAKAEQELLKISIEDNLNQGAAYGILAKLYQTKGSLIKSKLYLVEEALSSENLSNAKKYFEELKTMNNKEPETSPLRVSQTKIEDIENAIKQKTLEKNKGNN